MEFYKRTKSYFSVQLAIYGEIPQYLRTAHFILLTFQLISVAFHTHNFSQGKRSPICTLMIHNSGESSMIKRTNNH